MNAKKYLQQAARLDEEIDRKMAELARLHALSLSAPPGPAGSPAVKKLLRLAGEVSREIDELADRKADIRTAIDAVPDPEEREVLRCRYLDGMMFDQIAAEMHLGKRTVYRRHDRGLRYIARRLGKNP